MVEPWVGLVAPLAAAGTPVWATIVVAALSGVFGFASGAAAAAIVNTRAERRERFRDRMIEAADDFVIDVAKALRALDDVWEKEFAHLLMALDFAVDEDQLGRLKALAEERSIPTADGPGRYDPAILESIRRRKRDQLATATRTISSLEDKLGRLGVVFRDPAVADSATTLVVAIGMWVDRINKALKPREMESVISVRA